MYADLKLVFGHARNGLLMHVDQMPSGLACDCVCPACGRRLIGKRGQRRRHHFAHEGDAECPYPIETAVHKLAKQILAEPGVVLLPELSVANRSRTALVSVQSRGDFRYTDASLEHHVAGIVVDAFLSGGDFPLAIEVTVTHRCDLPKIDQFRQANLASLEIDLSHALTANSTREVSDQVRHRAPRQWLFHPGREAALQQLRQTEDEAHLERHKREYDAIARRRQEQGATDATLKTRLRAIHDRSEIARFLPDAETPNGRENVLTREAANHIGPDATEWLRSPCLRLNGHTPRATARDSITGLRRALELLAHFPRARFPNRNSTFLR